jgi:hypothetical protein
LLSRTEFTKKYAPFHSNNISATVGGPIVPGHNIGFFFFAIEPLRASAAVTTNISFEDPQFTAFAQSAFPATIGTQLLTKYPVNPGRISNRAVSSTSTTLYPSTCGTAASSFLPCGLPMVDNANYTDTDYRNGTQYNFRLDKTFASDRLYGSVYRTTLDSNTPNARSAFAVTNAYHQWAIQVNETHTFSPTTLNEAAFAGMRVEGVLGTAGLFSVPLVKVTSINVDGLGNALGAGFAQGDFIQHNYHWRDVLTHTIKSHAIKVGYEGLFADDVEVFNGPLRSTDVSIQRPARAGERQCLYRDQSRLQPH